MPWRPANPPRPPEELNWDELVSRVKELEAEVTNFAQFRAAIPMDEDWPDMITVSISTRWILKCNKLVGRDHMIDTSTLN